MFEWTAATIKRFICPSTTGLVFALMLIASLGQGKLGAQTSRPHPAGPTEPLQITISGPKEAFVDRPTTFQVQIHNTGAKASEKLELAIGHFSLKSKTIAAARALDDETVKVLVAKTNLATGTIIKRPEEMFEEKELPKEAVPKNALSKFEETKGRLMKIPRRPGDTITADDLFTDNLLDILPPGHRAVGLKVSAEQIANGFAAVPGSRVDIACTSRDKDGSTCTKIILQNILVLASGAQTIRDESGKPMMVDVVTLALTTDDALKLETTRAQGKLSMFLRPFGDDSKIPKADEKDKEKQKVKENDCAPMEVEGAGQEVKQDRPRMTAAVQTRIPLAPLAAKEKRTVTLTLTPRRIGKFKVELGIDRVMPARSPLDLEAAAEVEIKFDPKTPLHEFLPPQPKHDRSGKPRLPRNLAEVPEVAFEDVPARSLKSEEAAERMAHAIDRVLYVNEKKQDGFMEALSKRPDLAGLSFVMGDACRLREEPSRQFGLALLSLRSARVSRSFTNVGNTMANVGGGGPQAQAAPPSLAVNDSVLPAFRRLCDEADERQDAAVAEHAMTARVAALMQVLNPEAPPLRLGLVKYLAVVPHAEATRALAKLAIFSEEEEVRRAALDALKTRREKDYTSVLMQGLSYPWPAVAKRASEAIVKLERTDMVPQLLDVLDRPDPRAPQVLDKDNRQTTVVRELVRINHHRNCLLCHAPARADGPPVAADLAAEMPLPNVPLPSASSGSAYGNSNVLPEHAVRIDVTYLRQDFSVKLAVAGAHPWPEMQRFDFVVRVREVSEDEAKDYRQLLQGREPGVFSPYHQAALFALRELTGRDTEPTAAAWRKLLAADKRAP